jgi:CheY-like chemotaxis protein
LSKNCKPDLLETRNLKLETYFPMSKQNILVAEDEELMRSILRQLLENAGYEVFTADSAEAALEIFPTRDFAVTLTDIKMAGMDGLELLDRFKGD